MKKIIVVEAKDSRPIFVTDDDTGKLLKNYVASISSPTFGVVVDEGVCRGMRVKWIQGRHGDGLPIDMLKALHNFMELVVDKVVKVELGGIGLNNGVEMKEIYDEAISCN
tara:strand:- start:47554 stop:47883 length:330 start_codon:yes stop_codon:yes gene_type:complete